MMMGRKIKSDDNKITISLNRTMVIGFLLGLVAGYLLHRWISERLYYNVPEYWTPNPPMYNPKPSFRREENREIEDFDIFNFREQSTSSRSKKQKINVGDEYAEYELCSVD